VKGEEGGKKHPCADCRFCQWCGEERCTLCRGKRPPGAKKLSIAEQIALYEALNGREREGEK
jgi:hypothetical protein